MKRKIVRLAFILSLVLVFSASMMVFAANNNRQEPKISVNCCDGCDASILSLNIGFRTNYITRENGVVDKVIIPMTPVYGGEVNVEDYEGIIAIQLTCCEHDGRSRVITSEIHSFSTISPTAGVCIHVTTGGVIQCYGCGTIHSTFTETGAGCGRIHR